MFSLSTSLLYKHEVLGSDLQWSHKSQAQWCEPVVPAQQDPQDSWAQWCELVAPAQQDPWDSWAQWCEPVVPAQSDPWIHGQPRM